MLDRLGGRDETRVESRLALVLLHDLLAFLDDAEDCVAGLSLRLRVDLVEYLLEAFDVLLGLIFVFCEGGAQLLRLGRLGHLGQSSEDLLLGEVDVLQRVVEKVAECLLFCHVCLLLALRLLCVRDRPAPSHPSWARGRDGRICGLTWAGRACSGTTHATPPPG